MRRLRQRYRAACDILAASRPWGFDGGCTRARTLDPLIKAPNPTLILHA